MLRVSLLLRLGQVPKQLCLPDRQRIAERGNQRATLTDFITNVMLVA
jgi:hypothetical protein